MAMEIDPRKDPYLFIMKEIEAHGKKSKYSISTRCIAVSGMAIYAYLRGDITRFEYDEIIGSIRRENGKKDNAESENP